MTRIDVRDQRISRLLGNARIDFDWVMAPFAAEVLERASANGRRLGLIMDQTMANDTHQAIVTAARVGGSVLPIAWRLNETNGRSVVPSRKPRSMRCCHDGRMASAGRCRPLSTGARLRRWIGGRCRVRCDGW